MDKKCRVEGLQIRWLQSFCPGAYQPKTDVNEVKIHMHRSVRSFSFYSKQGAAIFSLSKNTNKSATKINKNLPTLLQFNCSSIIVLKNLKFDFYTKISFLHLSSANWIFTMMHVHFSNTYDVTESRIKFDTFQFYVEQ